MVFAPSVNMKHHNSNDLDEEEEEAEVFYHHQYSIPLYSMQRKLPSELTRMFMQNLLTNMIISLSND